MSQTKIVLDRQADLILTNATITSPTGIVAADIANGNDGNLSQEISALYSNDASLSTAVSTDLSSEASSRVAGENSLATSLSTEVDNREGAISAEESRSIVAETSLQNNIDAEASLRVVGDQSVATVLSTSDAALDSKISTETDRAESAEASLEDRIDYIVSNVDPAALDSLTEIVTAFQDADGDLNGAITSLATAAVASLSAEVSRATTAEASLASDLSTEVADRVADVSLEEAARISGDNSLEADLSTEVVNRGNAVSAEESARISSDNSLQIGIDNLDYSLSIEEEARVSADSSLAADLSTEVVKREDAVSTIESTFTAADASIAADLSSEIESLADVDNATISLDTATNLIKLKETIAAPDSGTYTFNSNVEISGALTVDGVDVMVELSTQVSYLISNIDVTEIDSFTEIVSELSNEISNRESGDASLEGLVSDEIAGLALTDGQTIDVNTADNTIRLMETVAAPASGLRTFASDVEISGILTVDGVDVIENVTNLSNNTYNFVVANRPTMIGFNESPDGTNTEFTAYVQGGSEIVFVNGLILTSGSDYDVSIFPAVDGDVITVDFYSAPLVTDKVNIYGVPSGTPWDGTSNIVRDEM